MHPPGNRVGSPLNQMHRQRLELLLSTCCCRDTGEKRTRRAQRTSFNPLDNWGHKTPTQSKRKRTGKKGLKGHDPEHTRYAWFHLNGIFCATAVTLTVITNTKVERIPKQEPARKVDPREEIYPATFAWTRSPTEDLLITSLVLYQYH